MTIGADAGRVKKPLAGELDLGVEWNVWILSALSKIINQLPFSFFEAIAEAAGEGLLFGSQLPGYAVLEQCRPKLAANARRC